MSHSIPLVVAIFIASICAAHAQVSSDPQAVAPVVYDGAPNAPANCAGADPHDPACVSVGDSPPADEAITDNPPAYEYPPGYDYVPDYWEAPPAYGGVPDYWGGPWYGYGWDYGWPYYGYAAFGFGWPYYVYCCYWYSYAWNDHGHHDHGDHGGHGDHGHGGGDHGGWHHGGGDHGGHGNHGYPGPYRYLGHGQYANQLPNPGGGTGARGDRPAGTMPPHANEMGLARADAVPGNGHTLNGAPDNSPRTAAVTSNRVAGQGRFAGRAVLPSASYYAAARSAANPALAGDRVAQAPAYRGSTTAGYGYGRGNADNTSAANENYHVTAMPGRGYASANYAASRQATARAGTNVVPRSYAARVAPSYYQPAYAAANHAYVRGAAPSYSAPRPPAYSYPGRGAMPSYARGGSYSAPHVGNAGFAAPRGGGNAYVGSHAGTTGGR
jgi:hypothetical protein